jgi:hypothetical protein
MIGKVIGDQTLTERSRYSTFVGMADFAVGPERCSECQFYERPKPTTMNAVPPGHCQEYVRLTGKRAAKRPPRFPGNAAACKRFVPKAPQDPSAVTGIRGHSP